MTAFILKIIALASMLIDHVAVTFPLYIPLTFRAVGRLAWPIFAFFVAEGFRHTKSQEKFLMRLIAFAVISEIPYDLVMGNGINFLANTNIFYTLSIGGLAVYFFEKMKLRYSYQVMAVLGALFPTVLLAEFLTVEYGSMGVLFIFSMYAIKPKPLRLAALGGFALAQFLPLVMARPLGVVIPPEVFLMIACTSITVPLIALYNGKRGVNAKWLFYCAYPVHLSLLAFIALISL
ncbi:MAG: conjugal transfer protein TraX [Defluviitaleaceae bacterium]|nr:conjugal transfer protein TraX [Defluviitaleaceae bacterium]